MLEQAKSERRHCLRKRVLKGGCIPVVVLTTSNAEDNIQRTYDLGVSAYISKPGSFSGLLDLVRSLNLYWINFVTFSIV